MRQATPRAWRALVLGAVVLAAAVLPAPASEAQENPLEPTGRAICNIAFTLASAVGLTSFVVPPEAPLGPNEVIVALRPILDTCVQVFPPAPPRRCATADLVPNTGLPLTVPDAGGIVSEQVDALAAALGPLGAALTGPLRDVFLEGLQCRDATEPNGSDGGELPDEEVPGGAPEVAAGPDEPAGPTSPLAPEPVLPVPAGDEVAAPVDLTPVPPAAFRSNVPAPLGGAEVAATVAFVVAGAAAARRLLTRRRPPSLLDLGSSSPR